MSLPIKGNDVVDSTYMVEDIQVGIGLQQEEDITEDFVKVDLNTWGWGRAGAEGRAEE